MSNSLRHYGLQPAKLLCPWDSPGNNTGVGCHALLQGIFMTQGLNLQLLYCRQILYHQPTGEASIVLGSLQIRDVSLSQEGLYLDFF